MDLWARQALAFAWPMLWQSSLLMAIVFVLELGLRRKVRAAVRYALWLVVLLKLLLPPSLAFPSGVGWWLRPSAPKTAVHREPQIVVSYGEDRGDELPKLTTMPAPSSSLGPAVSLAAWCAVVWSFVSLALLGWMIVRWGQIAREARAAHAAPDWMQPLEETRRCAGLGRFVRLKIRDRNESPAVCGLFRPTILMSRALLEQLTPTQIRAVLLHELLHIRRGDVWVNCAQSLLQIAYWWHPLLWLANARIRHVREEAVDDGVMLALRSESDTYAPTLVEVAKLALRRPLLNLGLVGIFESQSSLRRRIERLIDFRPPSKAGLTLGSTICVLGMAALALPMGEAPPSSSPAAGVTSSGKVSWPDPRFEGYAEIKLEPQFLIANESSLRAVLPSLIAQQEPLLLTSNEMTELVSQLKQAEAQPYNSAEPLSFGKFSGGTFHWWIGGVTNNGVNYLTQTAGEQTIVTGAEVGVLATQPDWIPLELTVVPWAADAGVRCQMRLGIAENPNSAETADVAIPRGGAVVWAALVESNARRYEIVVLREQSGATNAVASSESKANPAGEEGSASGVSTNRVVASITSEQKPGKEPELDDLLKVEGKRWSIESPVQNTNSATAVVRATNGALLRYGQTTVNANQVTFILSNRELKEVVAEGNVRIQQGAQNMASDHLWINFANSTNGEAAISTPSVVASAAAGARSKPLTEQGKGLYEKGKLSSAGALLTEGLKEDPKNNMAHYYLYQVKLAIYRKLRETRLQTVSFNNSPLREVLAELTDWARDADFEQNAITFTYQREPDDIGDVPITIEPPLTDIRLVDVIDAVAKVSPTPLKYSVTASGVEFSRKFQQPVALYTRIIKVDPQTFVQNLMAAIGAKKGTTLGPTEIRDFFKSQGVDFEPSKSIFFNDGEGYLMVRGTLADLDKVERAVYELNREPTQINLKANFVSLPEELAAPIYSSLRLTVIPTASPPALSAVVTPAQSAVLLKALESADGVVLNAASVTTLSGRETQIQVVDLKTVVTNLNLKALNLPGISSKENGTNGLYQTATIPFGPILDVIPAVLPDGHQVRLVVEVTITEFLGYADPGSELPAYVDGKRTSVVRPLPRTRVGKVKATLVVPEGQTLLLGTVMSEEPAAAAPMPKPQNKQLLVFLTPLIINPGQTLPRGSSQH